jgi:alkanesulfonate monooxygenase SsuD/methylene tetrahydromethanopterin reductase-like flavin-dependent oxidoreductase (luciferase family)
MRIGARFEPDWPAEDLVPFARAAEEQGYDELWVVEDCFWTGAVATATAALTATSRLRVGIGLLPAGVRNPATVAMELAAMARIAPSRLRVAFGRGIPDWMDKIGARLPGGVADLERTVAVVRRLLAGEHVEASDEALQLDGVQLGHPPPRPPEILIGTTGPRGFAAAARCADGVLLAEVTSPSAISWVREEMQQAGKAGRIVAYALLSLDQDSQTGIDAVFPHVAQWATSDVFAELASRSGLKRGNPEVAPEVVRSMAVAGDASDCLTAIQRWEEAGIDTLVLISRFDNGPEQLAAFARDVLPRVRTR